MKNGSIIGADAWAFFSNIVKVFDGTPQLQQVTGAFGVNAPGALSFGISLYATSHVPPGGGFFHPEAYSSLGHPSRLGGFGLDDSYLDERDGLKVSLTFTPHLNFSGQSVTSDLALVSGETLSGYGIVTGDLSGAVGAMINCASGELTIGDAASVTGIDMAGDVAVTGGRLLLRDADAAVLGGHTQISGAGTLRVAGELQNDGEITLSGGLLDVGRLTGAGSLEWTQGTLKSEAVVVGPEFMLGESLIISVGQELIADSIVETGGSLTMTGGTVFGKVDAWNGSKVDISGGSLADGYGPSDRQNRLYAHKDSEVNLFGSEFVLDGIDITSTLNPNDPFVIDDRDVIFSGLLADGSPFSFDLEYFSPEATLTVTLVPEPSASVLLICIILAAMPCGRCVTSPYQARRFGHMN